MIYFSGKVGGENDEDLDGGEMPSVASIPDTDKSSGGGIESPVMAEGECFQLNDLALFSQLDSHSLVFKAFFLSTNI